MSKVLSQFRQLSHLLLGENVTITFNDAYPALRRTVQLVPSDHGVIYQAQAYDASAELGNLFYCDESDLWITFSSPEEDADTGSHTLQNKIYEFLWAADNGQIAAPEIAEAIGVAISLTVLGSAPSERSAGGTR